MGRRRSRSEVLINELISPYFENVCEFVPTRSFNHVYEISFSVNYEYLALSEACPERSRMG